MPEFKVGPLWEVGKPIELFGALSDELAPRLRRLRPLSSTEHGLEARSEVET